MSLRAIWVLSLSKDELGNILLYRRFPTIEKKCKSIYGDNYVPLPSPTVFANNILVKLGLTPDSKEFVEWRDQANRLMQLPVIELNLLKESLWPIVAITQSSYLVCCLPFIENYHSIHKENLLQISAISVGFSVLLGILSILETVFYNEQMQDKLIELDNCLSITMPFGTPSDVELLCASSVLKASTQKFLKRQPAWKPVEYRGKQFINIRIAEFIRCVMCEQAGSICQFETFGQVSVKAGLEGGVNDVSLSVTSTDPSQPLALDSVIIHPCVNISGGSNYIGTGMQKRLRFSPPSHEFVLFHYKSSIPKEPPIKGIFKMIGESTIELLIQLKLNEKVKNSFDFCEVILVFFNKGPVKNIEFNANYGTVRLSEDKYTLKWSLGSKFPKDYEVALTAKLDFLDHPVLPNSDPFCVNKNSFVQVNFKQNNVTLSGCNIDSKSVTVSEGNKPKIIIERSIQSAEYRIWNNYGELPFPVNIVNKFQKVFNNLSM